MASHLLDDDLTEDEMLTLALQVSADEFLAEAAKRKRSAAAASAPAGAATKRNKTSSSSSSSAAAASDDDEEEDDGDELDKDGATCSVLGNVHPAGKALVVASAGMNARAPVSVLVDQGEICDVELLQVDVARNIDKFYNLQVLVARMRLALPSYFVFSRWGRTGLVGQCNLDGPFASSAGALDSFARQFADKTGNKWSTRHQFVPKSNAYTMIKVDHKKRAAASLATAKPEWEYFIDDGVDGKSIGWHPYAPEGAANCESLWVTFQSNSGLAKRVVQFGNFAYLVDLARSTQTNLTSGRERKIRRLVHSALAAAWSSSSSSSSSSSAAADALTDDDDYEDIDDDDAFQDEDDDDEHPDAAAAAAPIPLHVMKEGDSITIHGSSANMYEIRLRGGLHYCTCQGWKTSKGSVDQKTCKHLRTYLGDEFETWRCGRTAGGASSSFSAGLKSKGSAAAKAASSAVPRPRGASGVKEAVPKLLLAHEVKDRDVSGYWLSEKLDGVRAFWNGKIFVSRLGNEYVAPHWFVAGLPVNVTLDGEIWGGRKQFQKTVGIVKRINATDDWKTLTYEVFDVPSMGQQPFEQRIEYLKTLQGCCPYLRVVAHKKCANRAMLEDYVDRITAAGGEGAMVRQPGSVYVGARSTTLLKVKRFLDDEVEIIAHEKGKGKYSSVMGSIKVKLKNGLTCSVGSGFTDAQRAHPPKIGEIVVIKYQELTVGGIPRFPTYIGPRAD